MRRLGKPKANGPTYLLQVKLPRQLRRTQSKLLLLHPTMPSKVPQRKPSLLRISPWSNRYAKLRVKPHIVYNSLAVSQLQLYGLYKQATGSQLPKQRPSIVDMRGRAKYDAWAKVSSISADEARKRYISMVNSLLPKESEAKPMSGPGSGSGTERSMAKVVSVLETLGGSGKSWAGEENEPSYLAKHGNLSRLEALVAKEPALVDKQDSEGLAAIHWACDNGSVEMVKRLLALGCDVDLKDGEGLTPLAYAVINDYRDLALYLVKQGADIHAKDNSGESVLDMASATPELQQALQAI